MKVYGENHSTPTIKRRCAGGDTTPSLSTSKPLRFSVYINNDIIAPEFEDTASATVLFRSLYL
ncbi:MAG: hypothetical protein HDS08_00410 [Bacteroides sp.]|nr:hypothetical protein [Bacteroides sp.]